MNAQRLTVAGNPAARPRARGVLRAAGIRRAAAVFDCRSECCSPSPACSGSRSSSAATNASKCPPMFWPLAAYAGATLVASVVLGRSARSASSTASSCCSSRSCRSPTGCCRPAGADGRWTSSSPSAPSAPSSASCSSASSSSTSLGQRPRGLLGMYMTYSGQLMLVACIAAARVLFRKRRSRLGGARHARADRRAGRDAQPQRLGRRLRRHRPAVPDPRLPAVRPAAGGRRACSSPSRRRRSPIASTRRSSSTTLRHDSATTESSLLSNRDRLAMIRSGLRIIKDDPLTGVGPDMVHQGLRRTTAIPKAVSQLNSAPAQRAAADRRRTRAAGARALAVVHRHAAARFRRECRNVGHARRCQWRRSPATSRCSPPACSSTTSAIPSS